MSELCLSLSRDVATSKPEASWNFFKCGSYAKRTEDQISWLVWLLANTYKSHALNKIISPSTPVEEDQDGEWEGWVFSGCGRWGCVKKKDKQHSASVSVSFPSSFMTRVQTRCQRQKCECHLRPRKKNCGTGVEREKTATKDLTGAKTGLHRKSET